MIRNRLRLFESRLQTALGVLRLNTPPWTVVDTVAMTLCAVGTAAAIVAITLALN